MKKIEIKLKDTNKDFLIEENYDVHSPILYESEYPYIFLKEEISEDDLNKAIDVITTFFIQKGINNLIVDLEQRNDAMMPTKEMTIKEIEKILGHKIKIVK